MAAPTEEEKAAIAKNGMPTATLQDFPIGPAEPADIDLLAICRKDPR